MLNRTCSRIKKFLALLCLLTLPLAPIFAATQTEQTIEWKKDPNALEYKIEIRPMNGGKPLLLRTKGNSITVTLELGSYKYRVTALDFLGRESSVSDWIELDLLKSSIPVIEDISEEAEVVPKNGNLELAVHIMDISTASVVELVNEKGEVFRGQLHMAKDNVSQGGSETEHADTVTFDDLPDGEYKIRITNPSGKTTESDYISVQKSEASTSEESAPEAGDKNQETKGEAQETEGKSQDTEDNSQTTENESQRTEDTPQETEDITQNTEDESQGTGENPQEPEDEAHKTESKSQDSEDATHEPEDETEKAGNQNPETMDQNQEAEQEQKTTDKTQEQEIPEEGKISQDGEAKSDSIAKKEKKKFSEYSVLFGILQCSNQIRRTLVEGKPVSVTEQKSPKDETINQPQTDETDETDETSSVESPSTETEIEREAETETETETEREESPEDATESQDEHIPQAETVTEAGNEIETEAGTSPGSEEPHKDDSRTPSGTTPEGDPDFESEPKVKKEKRKFNIHSVLFGILQCSNQLRNTMEKIAPAGRTENQQAGAEPDGTKPNVGIEPADEPETSDEEEIEEIRDLSWLPIHPYYPVIMPQDVVWREFFVGPLISIFMPEGLMPPPEHDAPVDRVGEEVLAMEPVLKKREEEEKKEKKPYVCKDVIFSLGAGLFTDPIDDTVSLLSDWDIIPVVNARLTWLPYKGKKWKLGYELAGKFVPLLSSNEFYESKTHIFLAQFNLVYQHTFFSPKIFWSLRLGPELGYVGQGVQYSQEYGSRHDIANNYIRFGAQAGLSLFWIPAKYFTIETGVDASALLNAGFGGLIIDPYICFGLRL
ncbi:MAG: hypothetical protein VZR56_04885 [Treponema sp.]|nr:hypothetical protein [Treponema sp.]